ncbi:MAG: protein kinase [Pseudomonadota bacterium]
MTAAEGQVVLPSQFGRYTLIERLALGGMAEVFRAKIVSSHGFEKVIVIKRILPHLAADRTFVTMFIDEAKLTAQLTHPKIVQVLDFGEVAGQYFIALEFIDGFDALALLRAAAQRRVRVPLPLIVFVIAEILDALDYAHTAPDMEGRPMRLVHRDISPSNIFISRHGDVKLGDFGIAHASDRESKTQAGTLKGKYGYMSPEQVIGAGLDGRSDLFAVGIVLAEAFMGRRLFTARNDLDVLLMVRDGRLDRLNRYGQDLPPELNRIVRKALRRDIEARYQTAAGFRDELSDYLFSQKLRVGPADLRAFMSDLFDTSAEALARVQKHGRRLAEIKAEPSAAAETVEAAPAARPSTPGPAAGPATPPSSSNAAVDPRRDTIPMPSVMTDADAEEEAGAPVGATDPANGGARAVGPDPPPGSPLAEALSGLDLALVDLDQWSVAEPNSSARSTGWTPVTTPPPPRQPLGTPAVPRALPGAPGATLGFGDTKTDLGKFVSAAPRRPPDSAGDLGTISAMRVFADVTVAGETGLLRFERDGAPGIRPSRDAEIKEVFLANGAPESVNSSVPGERFGAYLVSRGVLRAAELEMALGMLPHFSGKLGDTLVGLGLMRPLDVFRQLSQQVRDRVIDLFRWSHGTFAFYRGVNNDQESFPLGLDGFEILGAGVLTVPAADLEHRFSALASSRPKRSERRQIDPDAFNLGPTPRDVLALLDGERTLESWMGQFSAPEERATFLRSLYLLIESDLAELDE